MRNAQQWIAEYSESHRNPVNKRIHWVAVPLIVWSVIALLWSIPVPQALQFHPWLNFGSLFIVLALFFYIQFGFALWLTMAVAAVLMMAVNYWIDTSLSVPLWLVATVVFVGSWIVQFIGHQIEGKKPSFFKDIFFLLVGPAWLINYALIKLGLGGVGEPYAR